MPNDSQPQIFLSYAWANVDIANAIDNDFNSVGITFQRDIRDIKYTESIKDFMHRIGKSNFVLMLISDEYIKSENCMYEVIELLNSHEFEKRILPVTLENSDIFSRGAREKYYDYWSEKLEDVKKYLIKHPDEKHISDKKKVENIYNCLGAFFQKITDFKSEKYIDLKKSGYKAVLDRIGFDERNILVSLITILNIKNKKERELNLKELLKKHPTNKYILFQKAHEAENNREFSNAKTYYEELIAIHPNFAESYNNLANILKIEFNDYLGAKYNYEKALQLNPGLEIVHNNLALLLYTNFDNYKEARRQYEIAITINPSYFDPYYNLALLLENHYNEYDTAAKKYEKAIEIDPNSVPAHINLGLLLQNYFSKYQEAKKHYEFAISINPQNEVSYFNLGILFHYYLFDYINARKNYEKAIEINPQFDLAKQDLSTLIKAHFS